MSSSLFSFIEGAFAALTWSAAGFAAWWIMFRAPLGRRNIRTSLRIAAPPGKVWSSLLLEPAPPGGWTGALEIARQAFEGDPPVRHRALVRHGGTGNFEESVWRILRLAPGLHFEAEQETMGGAAVEPATLRLRLTQDGESTTVEHETRRLVRGVFGHLYLPRSNRRFLEHVKAHCEGREAHGLSALLSRRANALMALSAFLGIVVLFAAFDPEVWEVAAFVALFLQIAMWVHEYGHLIALRWFGHKQATMMIVPFFGGAAIGARAATTRFENAIVALMGPAFSGAILLAATPVAGWGVRFITSGEDLYAPAYVSSAYALKAWSGLCAVAFLALAIPINLYNLVPLGMLDGGRVVAALARGRLSAALLTLAIFAALAYAIAGAGKSSDFGAALAFVAVVWVIGLLTAEKTQEDLAPMNGLETFVAATLLIVTLTIYVDASRTLMPAFIDAMERSLQSPVATASTQGDIPAPQTASP
jgi:Zn-dependent protease